MGSISAVRKEDISTVRDLVVRERYFKDTCQWDRWRACYHPDSGQTLIETVWISGTIDDFLSGSKQMTGRVFSRHLIQPVDAQINSDKALIISYGHVVLRAAIGHTNEEYDVFAWGWWYHRACLVKLLDGCTDWKLTSMRFVYDRDSLVPLEPYGATKLEKIKFDVDARPSYKYLGWMLAQLEYPFSKTLAGTDQPSTIVKLREEEENWLAT